jgi:hypothetical protein
MSLKLVTYDLRQPSNRYADLYAEIAKLGPSQHGLDSMWIVRTNLTCGQVIDHLQRFIGTRDSLMVTELSGKWASLRAEKALNEWLHANNA